MKRADRIAKQEKHLRNLTSKIDYICKMNQNLKVPKDGDSEDGILTKMKLYIDNNRAVAALFMIFLNIGSRYITLNITSSQEYYLRKLLLPELLVFAISWMGSRDILIAAAITTGYSIMTRLLFNEDSNFCILKKRMSKVKNLIDINNDNKVSDKELDQAIKVLAKARSKGELGEDTDMQGGPNIDTQSREKTEKTEKGENTDMKSGDMKSGDMKSGQNAEEITNDNSVEELFLKGSMSIGPEGVQSLEIPVFEGLNYKNATLPMQQAGHVTSSNPYSGGYTVHTGLPQVS